MKIDSRLLKILANKPDLVTDFPEWMLSDGTVEKIRRTSNVAIAEIAGRDSVAAVIRACRICNIKAVVPTTAFTGTEYGNWDVTFEKIEFMKERLKNEHIKIFNVIVLGSPRFWWKLCGRYTADLFRKYGYYTPCTGCHLYLHAIRVPLAKLLHCTLVIGGEREFHDGKVKVNQTGVALDAYIELLRRFDIELFLPLRKVKSGKEIEDILGKTWSEGEEQLACVLSKNYQNRDGKVVFDKVALKKYFHEFALKTAEDEIRKHLFHSSRSF